MRSGSPGPTFSTNRFLPFFLQPCVELLQIVLCELAEQYFADVGDDMIVDSVSVAFLGVIPDCRSLLL